MSKGCSFWIADRMYRLEDVGGTYVDGRYAKNKNAGRDRYRITTQDLGKVRVAGLLYQCQKELPTPRRYSYIGEVGLQLSSQRLNALITKQLAPVRPKLSQMANKK